MMSLNVTLFFFLHPVTGASIGSKSEPGLAGHGSKLKLEVGGKLGRHQRCADHRELFWRRRRRVTENTNQTYRRNLSGAWL